MYKQVIVIRTDLKMDKGKTAVQVAHASVDAYNKAGEEDIEHWMADGEKKVVAKVENVKTLLDIFMHAKGMKLPCSLIKDAGKTQLAPGTITAVGIGPAREEDIDKVTGNLKLL